MKIPKRCFFFDFHTMPACPDVGGAWDAELLAEQAFRAGADWMTFPAKCNLGMAYYPTGIGTVHPALERAENPDLIGTLLTACHRRGLGFSAYLNVGLSHEQLLRHREWEAVAPVDAPAPADRLNSFFRKPCLNTGYREWQLAMIREVVKCYPVDGMFFDCLHARPCVCPECVRRMRAEGIDWSDNAQAFRFNQRSILAMCRAIRDVVLEVRPGTQLFFNGPEYSDLRGIATYIEYECLPNGGWGYDALPVYGHYLRRLGLPVVNMTARFHHSWSDFGGLCPREALMRDCLCGLANAVDGTTIGDHLHPRGVLPAAVERLESSVFQELRRLDEWMTGARAVTDIAVLVPKLTFNTSTADSAVLYQAAKGAARMLDELKMQYDIVSDDLEFSGYPVLVVADTQRLAGNALAQVERHLAAGGSVIAGGKSGLNSEETEFALPAWGVRYRGAAPYDPVYMTPGTELGAEYDGMPLSLYGGAELVEPLPGTEVLAELTPPYYNRIWDGEHGHVYNPPDAPSGEPAVARSAQVTYFAAPLFSCYAKYAYGRIREIFARTLLERLPRPLLKTENLPSFARATVTEQQAQRRRMVHISGYVPELRGDGVEIIEDTLTLANVRIRLRLDAKEAWRRVYLAPERRELDFVIIDGYCSVDLPPVTGYAVVVFEI